MIAAPSCTHALFTGTRRSRTLQRLTHAAEAAIVSEPSSREALVALLSELARGEVRPERSAAARAGIGAGLLASSDEVIDGVPLLAWAATWGDLEMVKLLLERGADIDAGNGASGTALHAAASKGDLALVELLLERGASPLGVRSTRESVLRAAHPHGPLFQRVRRAAKEASERSAFTGLATGVLDRRYALRTDRGAHDLRRAVEARRALDVLLVESDLKTTVKALASMVQAPRREADVASRPVQDAQRLAFLYRLRGIDWTIIPLVFEAASPWNVEQVPELAAAGSGIAHLARALARAAERRVVHVKYDEHTIYSEHGGIETRSGDAMGEELRVLIPPMSVGTDGYHVRLQLFGVERSDLERVDLVVLQELGEPAIVRTTALPAAAPAVVGAPVLLMSGLPAMVEAPAIGRSEAPPLVREPIAPADLGPAISDAPPMAREAPPMIPGAAPPPIVEAAPPSREPPPMVRLSDTPPLVRAPPPMVTTPPTTEEHPADDEA